jgi:hypothetical protein
MKVGGNFTELQVPRTMERGSFSACEVLLWMRAAQASAYDNIISVIIMTGRNWYHKGLLLIKTLKECWNGCIISSL